MRVACMMMQKDEDLLLEAWIKYYSYLFGYENLYIIDNGSSNPNVIESLKKFGRLGCKILYAFSTPLDFIRKGDIISDLFRLTYDLQKYDFMIPLDCDEFIAFHDNVDVKCDKSLILAELDRYRGTEDTIKINTEFRNSRKYLDYFYALACNKTAFAGGTVTELDHGYHTPATKTGQLVDSQLCYIHMHNKPHHRLVADAQQKLANLNIDVSDIDAIQNAPHSFHLKEYFTKSEEDILSDLDQKCHYSITTLRQILDDLGAPIPFAHDLSDGMTPPNVVDFNFDVQEYLKHYPDVVAEGMDGTLHYMHFGTAEGRWPIKKKTVRSRSSRSD